MSQHALAPWQRWWTATSPMTFAAPGRHRGRIVTIALIVVALGANVIAPFTSMIRRTRMSSMPGCARSLGLFAVIICSHDPQGRDMLSAVIFGLRTRCWSAV